MRRVALRCWLLVLDAIARRHFGTRLYFWVLSRASARVDWGEVVPVRGEPPF